MWGEETRRWRHWRSVTWLHTSSVVVVEGMGGGGGKVWLLMVVLWYMVVGVMPG